MVALDVILLFITAGFIGMVPIWPHGVCFFHTVIQITTVPAENVQGWI